VAEVFLFRSIYTDAHKYAQFIFFFKFEGSIYMKRVLAHITACSERFEQEPMFRYLRDKSIDPKQRLCFMPMMAHFVFSFMDFNKYILRNEAVDSPLQRLINIHTYEDATHWPWWLRDMKNAGLDKACSLTEAMMFTWSEATRRTRMLTYDLIAVASRATPNQLLAIVETVEATGYKFQSTTAEVCREIDNNPFVYFGSKHLTVETGHFMGTDEGINYLESLELSEQEFEETIAIVDKLFLGFTNFIAEMHDWVTSHEVRDLRTQPFYREKPTNRAIKLSRPLSPGELTRTSPSLDQVDLPAHGATLMSRVEVPQHGSSMMAHAETKAHTDTDTVS
jgi:hypothetical protein